MYKSLLLCLVGVVCAQENKDLDKNMDDLLKTFIMNNIVSTEDTDNNVRKLVTILPPLPRRHDLDYQPCTTADGKQGQCVNFHLCDTTHTIVGDGYTLTYSDLSPVDSCTSHLDICCSIHQTKWWWIPVNN